MAGRRIAPIEADKIELNKIEFSLLLKEFQTVRKEFTVMTFQMQCLWNERLTMEVPSAAPGDLRSQLMVQTHLG